MLECYLLSKIIVWLEYLVKCQSVLTAFLSCQSHQEKYGLWFCPEGPMLVPEGSAVCLYLQSMSTQYTENTVNIIRHHGHVVSKLTCQESWQNIEDRAWLSAGSVVRLWCGSQSTVCVITGETVVYSSLNNNTQITGTHTRADLLCVDEMILTPPSGCSQSCRPPEATNFGLDWLWLCCQPSWLVEASSWRRKLCCDWPLLVTPEQVICINVNTLNFGCFSIFNWCKFCVCNIMRVSISLCIGDGGHGYLKDWLWWGGLLMSKICSLFH